MCNGSNERSRWTNPEAGGAARLPRPLAQHLQNIPRTPAFAGKPARQRPAPVHSVSRWNMVKLFTNILFAWAIYVLIGGEFFNIAGIAIGVFFTVYLMGIKLLNA